jgi:Fe-S-cluster containining protein
MFEKLVLWIFLGKKYKFLGKSGCPYLRYVGKLAMCMQYNKRPEFCKKYPAVRSDLIKDCGFNFKSEE